ncbi:hypothetical protein CYMTET_29695 [Cymbomonas tetramitiformis]|uniref:Uncharacterized protein n=1 Tax=Cymbomonas tetramitiformis TaxID=36881 RepID=A0AAE0FKF7_9CHLO|nr:hypothetical protein CYMTET_29695 [Cymbomonas tetramitiformis]
MSNKRQREKETVWGEPLPCLSFPEFQRELPSINSTQTADLSDVYTVYRSLRESGLWKEVNTHFSEALRLFYLSCLPQDPVEHLSPGKVSSGDKRPKHWEDEVDFDDEILATEPKTSLEDPTNREEDTSTADAVMAQDASSTSPSKPPPTAADAAAASSRSETSWAHPTITVPLNTSNVNLTPSRISSLFTLCGDLPCFEKRVTLAFVDANAFVTFSYVYNFMHPPVEAPEDDEDQVDPTLTQLEELTKKQ